MRLSHGILASFCHVLVYIHWTAAEMISSTGQAGDRGDRVLELDELLNDYAEEVSSGNGVHKLIAEMEKVSKGLKAKQSILDYYAHIAELLERQGPNAMSHEDTRIQDVITRAKSAEDKEVKIALGQRQILDAFYETTANYLAAKLDIEGIDGLQGMNFHDGNQQMFDANFAQQTVKQKKKKKKQKKIKIHEEM